MRNSTNNWATEVGYPRNIWDLLLNILKVSVQTVELVKGLPEVGINEYYRIKPIKKQHYERFTIDTY